MPPCAAAEIKSAYADALNLQQAGRDEAALAAYGQIVAENPNIAEVHFQIARIFLKNDWPDKALTHIRAAATLKPDVPDIWQVQARIVATLSDPEIRRDFVRDVKAAPLSNRDKGALTTATAFRGKSQARLGAMPQGEFARIVDALAGRRFDEAEALSRTALSRHPGLAPVLTTLAAALSGQNRLDEAEAAAREAIAAEPGYAEAHSTCARILRAAGKLREAVQEANAALARAPGMVAALLLRARAKADLGMIDEARTDYHRVLALAPDHDGAQVERARLLYDEKLFHEAEAALREALKRGADTAQKRQLLGLTLTELGRADEALAQFEAAQDLAPESETMVLRGASLLQTLGRFEESDDRYRAAIALNPKRGESYRMMLAARKTAPDDPLIAEMQAHFADETIPDEQRAHFGFALAKAMEDQKRYGAVFDYLHPANALMRRAHPYDIATRRTHVDRLLASYGSVDWAGLTPEGTTDYAPIFVTGMPRSGTTLVEQIVASHSQVTGAGEVGLAPGKALGLLGREGGTYRDADTIEPAALAELGERYAGQMRALYPDAPRITDKSIQSYAYIGLLKRAMPNARIVVVRRDPRDNLLSIYKNVFAEGTHLYAYSLSDLAAYYHMFVELVEFWRAAAPGWFHEIRYEDLVADPEDEARKLIAACGLDWEDGCLDFHKTERRVATLSLYQVRQPMYRSSTRAWERYGDTLDDLMAGLGPGYADAAE